MGLSISDLDATTASSTPFEFEYIDPAGNESGIYFRVLGAQAPEVEAARNKMINARRQKEAQREVNKRIGVGKRVADFELFESDIEFGQRLSAARLVGWRCPGDAAGLTAEQIERFVGINEPFSTDLAMTLCKKNAHISAQIMQQSDEMGNFMKR